MKAFLFKLWRALPIPFWLRWRMIWLLVQKFMVGAIAVIFDNEGRILLFHHTYRKKYPWGLPGGWLNNGEEAIRAIIRELQEEAGLTIQVQQPLFIGSSKQYPRIDIFYLCTYVQGEFIPSAEVSAMRFFDRNDLAQVMEPELYAMLTCALSRVDK